MWPFRRGKRQAIKTPETNVDPIDPTSSLSCIGLDKDEAASQDVRLLKYDICNANRQKKNHWCSVTGSIDSFIAGSRQCNAQLLDVIVVGPKIMAIPVQCGRRKSGEILVRFTAPVSGNSCT